MSYMSDESQPFVGSTPFENAFEPKRRWSLMGLIKMPTPMLSFCTQRLALSSLIIFPSSASSCSQMYQ